MVAAFKLTRCCARSCLRTRRRGRSSLAHGQALARPRWGADGSTAAELFRYQNAALVHAGRWSGHACPARAGWQLPWAARISLIAAPQCPQSGRQLQRCQTSLQQVAPFSTALRMARSESALQRQTSMACATLVVFGECRALGCEWLAFAPKVSPKLGLPRCARSSQPRSAVQSQREEVRGGARHAPPPPHSRVRPVRP